jgi:TP901 family phage tail tape measure protein
MARNEIRSKALTEVQVDGRNADQVLSELKAKADSYTRAMVEAQKANDKIAYDKASKSAKEYNQAIRSVERSTKDVNAVLKNLSGATMKELQGAQRKITSELNGMTRGTAEYIAKSKQLQLVTGEIRRVRTEMNGAAGASQGFFGKMANGFNKYFGLITGAVAALTGVGLGLRKLSNDAMEFESKVANLSAITGLAGQDLDWLKNKAKELSISVTEDGVRITKSADEIVDAFTLMGSAKPELLANKEALAMVTTEALKLAEAAQMQTSVAVESLANVMNQFGAKADQASKFVNVLAAGSKAGAAMVDQIAEAIIRFGPAAASANVSVEESVALIETLAEKGVKGERAGTALRTALLKLQTGADEFNPKVVGLSKALENLSNANLSAADLVKIFGQEAYTAGAILVDNVDRLEHFTQAVTGTNVAVEQAIINTDTQKAKLAQHRNELKLNAMELGQKLAPAMSSITFTMSKFIRFLSIAIPWLQDHWRIIVTLTTAITAYVIVLKAKEIWTKAVAAATWLAQKATMAFNTTLKANYLAIFIGLLTAAATYFGIFKSKASDAAKSVNELTEAQKAYNDLMTKNKSIEERMAIIHTLKKRQLDDLKNDIQSQIQLEEDFTSKLLTELKKRLNNDQYLQGLKSQLDSQTLDYLKAGIQNRIKIREQELQADLQKEYQSQKQRLLNLNTFLSNVVTAYSKIKESIEDGIEPDFDSIVKNLDDFLKQARLKILKDYLDGIIGKEEYNSQLQVLELSHLESMRAINAQYGKETIDLDEKIVLAKIKLMESLAEANRKIFDQILKDNHVNSEKLIDDSIKQTDEFLENEFKKYEEQDKRLAKLQEDALERKKQEAEQYKSITDTLGASLGELLGQMVVDAEMSAEQVAKTLMLIAIDALHGVVRMAVAEIWARSLASASSVATFGAAGVAKATAMSALVEGAFAALKATISSIGQRATGKYDVIGAEDGRTYRNVPYGGTPKTGIVSTPTIYGERGDELVVDNRTLRNLRMNFPTVLPAIRAAMVPQRAAGNVGEYMAKQPTNQSTSQSMDPDFKAIFKDLHKLLKNGIVAKVGYTHLKEQLEKGERIETAASKG